MTQHTPGPWVTDNGHAERDGIQVWDTVHGWIIADVVNDQHDNAEANAALIAAAPAMLDALLDITRWVDPDLDPLAGKILTKARAAIEAAERPGDTRS